MPILGDLKNFKPTEFQIFFLSIIFKSKIKVKVFANVKNLFICKFSVFFFLNETFDDFLELDS